MAIWLLERADNIDREETVAMVIEAKTIDRAREIFADALWIFGAPYDEEGREERKRGIAAEAKFTRLGATDKNMGERDQIVLHSRASS